MKIWNSHCLALDRIESAMSAISICIGQRDWDWVRNLAEEDLKGVRPPCVSPLYESRGPTTRDKPGVEHWFTCCILESPYWRGHSSLATTRTWPWYHPRLLHRRLWHSSITQRRISGPREKTQKPPLSGRWGWN